MNKIYEFIFERLVISDLDYWHIVLCYALPRLLVYYMILIESKERFYGISESAVLVKLRCITHTVGY